MKLEEILTLETNNDSVIHLVRDRLFWQAWEYSAFLFVSHFKKYIVHKRSFQKIAKDMFWLGFPKTVLPELEKLCKEKSWQFETISENHIKISGIPKTDGFEKWRSELLEKPSEKATKEGKKQFSTLPIYKEAYNLTIHVHRVTADVAKAFRYTLAERIKNLSLDILENIFLLINDLAEKSTLQNALKQLYKMRINLRLLMELSQISIQQWGYVNQQIEKLGKLLWGEFRRLRLAGETLFQSGGSLPFPQGKEQKW